MKPTTILKILNPILAVLVINQALTGILADHLPREVFEVLHAGGGLLFVVLAAVHLFLNWGWVKASFTRRAPAA